MKKLLKWVLPAFLGIVPILGADDSIGEIKDPFFTKDSTVRSISRVVESGPKLMAQVTATDNVETKNKLVEALCATVGWQNNDAQHYAQEIVKAQVICGSDFLEKDHVKALKTNYEVLDELEIRKLLNGSEVKETYEPLVGETVVVSKAQLYKRPDGSTYKEPGVELYQLMLEETRTPQPAFRHCQKEWKRFTQWENKTRHQVQTYARTDVTRTLFKVITGEEKIVWSTKVITELKPIQYEPEVPTCGHGDFPANSVIVS